MEIAVAVIVLFVALIMVVKGGDIFVSSSSVIAKKLHIPQIIFGATFMSLATTLSELLISIISSVDGVTDLAVGNAVGSAVCNIGLICGIAFIVLPSNMKGGGFLKYYLLIVATLFITILGFMFNIEIWQAFVLISLTLIFFVFNYIDSKNIKNNSNPQKTEEDKRPLWLVILFFIFGAGAIGGGAYLLVDKVEFLSGIIGVSEQFIGLTIVAVGTSLPELITVIKSIKNKSPYLAIGNIIGSNILNLTLILGVSKLVAWNSNMPITKETAYISLPLTMLLTLIITVPILVKQKTYRWQGIVCIILYAIYIIWLIVNALVKII